MKPFFETSSCDKEERADPSSIEEPHFDQCHLSRAHRTLSRLSQRTSTTRGRAFGGSFDQGGPRLASHSWRRPAAVALLFCGWLCSSASAGNEFVPLLNGNLSEWIYVGDGASNYFLQGEVLVCPAEEIGNLFSRKTYSNFVLRFEFRLQEASNNGVAIRSPLRKDAHLTGIEIQILDDQAPRYQGIVKPVQYHGSIYGAVAAKRGFLKKVGEWNEQEILADGRRIQVTLNGTVIVDANLDTVTDPGILREHPGLLRSKGHIGFLGHRSQVEFRNLRIKELP